MEKVSGKETRKGCPNVALNASRCPCEVGECPRRGICCECIEFHRTLGEVPACIAGGTAPVRREVLAEAPSGGPAGPRGDDFRLTDFASCGG